VQSQITYDHYTYVTHTISPQICVNMSGVNTV